jgi:uncharacterized Tic20 family protein
MSQEELAEAAKLSLRTVQRLEKGEAQARGFTLHALAQALDLPVEALTTVAEPGPVKSENAPQPVGSTPSPVAHEREEIPAYVALMYLSAFSYVLLPGANILLPLWLRYRKRYVPQIQEAGSRLLNFELVWTLLTYGGFFLLLAVQIGLMLYSDIVLVMTPLIYLLVLNVIHAPLLLVAAWRARQGRYEGYPVGVRLF